MTGGPTETRQPLEFLFLSLLTTPKPFHYDQASLPIMPRAKRTLAEADANAGAVAPVAKRNSIGKPQEKENDAAAGVKTGGKPAVNVLRGQLLF